MAIARQISNGGARVRQTLAASLQDCVERYFAIPDMACLQAAIWLLAAKSPTVSRSDYGWRLLCDFWEPGQ
jgi:hypothetical protein